MNEKKEYIDRALLRESFNEVLPDFWGVMQGEEIFAVIDSIVPADVAPVVHGEWLETNDKNKKKCSRCRVIHLIAQYPAGNIDYCPNCGAKMDGGSVETNH